MFATLRSDSTASASSLAPAAPVPTEAPLVPAVKAKKRLGGARKKPVKVAKRLGGARKKPVKAAKKAVVKPTMKRYCSCILCDGKPRKVAGEDEPCSCVMCWRNGADGTTGSGFSARKPFVMRRDCSCVVCGGRSKNCSCVMCGGTARPKRVVAKATKKSYEKYPSKVVSKQKKPRETVPEGRFAFRDFRWSSWKVAMVPSIPGNAGLMKNWEPCSRNAGFMRTDLFKDVLTKPAVYEVAVQPARGCKKYVVYCKSSNGLKMRRSWDSHILPRSLCTTVVDQALQNSCQIFVRSAPIVPQRKTVKIGGKVYRITSPAKIKDNLMTSTYDYAWQKRRNEDGCLATRLITRGHVVMSGTM